MSTDDVVGAAMARVAITLEVMFPSTPTTRAPAVAHAIFTGTGSPRCGPACGQVRSLGELRAGGLSAARIARNCRQAGPWREVLPGVVLTCRCAPTRSLRCRAALSFAGRCAILTGADALALQGITVTAHSPVQLLVPVTRRICTPDGLRIERTTKPPDPRDIDGMPCAPVPRAVLDLTRHCTEPADIQEALIRCLCAARCTSIELRAALNEGSQRGTALVRAALNSLCTSGWPILDERARWVIDRYRLIQPIWYPTQPAVRELVSDVWWPQCRLLWRFHRGTTALGTSLSRPTGGPPHRWPPSSAPLQVANYGALTVVCSTPEILLTAPHRVGSALRSAYLRAYTGSMAAPAGA
ncbi:MAG: hypothetical protein ACRDRL_25600 [Sciscionella sp.]